MTGRKAVMMQVRSATVAVMVAMTLAACSRQAPPGAAPGAQRAVPESQPGLTSVTGKAPAGTVVALDLPAGAEVPPPAGPVVMDQRGQQFLPDLLSARVGQVVEFRNGESIPHNVYVTRSSSGSVEFNVSTDPNQSYTHTFTQPGVYDVSCDIHPSMRASLVVVNTPYAATADSFGNFLIMNVPAGAYNLVTFSGSKTSERPVAIQGAHVDVGASAS